MVKKAAGAIALGAFALATPVAAESQIGSVTQPDYLGAIGKRLGGEQRPLPFRETVYASETVDTGSTATTSLEFLDETDLFVGKNSSVVLDKFIYDPERRVGEAAISFSKGAFRWVSGQMLNKDGFALRTPTASIAIRGTEFTVFVLEDGTSEINVQSGAVDVLPCRSDEPVGVGAGQSLLVAATCETSPGIARPMRVGALIPEMPDDLLALRDIEPAAGGGDDGDDGGNGADQSNNGDNRGKDDRPRGSSRGCGGNCY
ncbi:MAG: FecR family protein [Dongiaceae bacterium]